MQQVKALYDCSQQQLYEIGRTGWASYAMFLTNFGAFKPFYTEQVGIDALAAIDAAEEIMDRQAREAMAEMKRMELEAQLGNCLDAWQRLKSYINGAYGRFAKPQVEAAGQMYYAKASNEGWEQVKSLMNAGKQFLALNATKLQEDNNMPFSFIAQYNAEASLFASSYSAFLAVREAVPNATAEKVTANNAVFTDLMKMMGDGALIFRNEPTTKVRFVFEEVLKLITTAGPTGLRFRVTEAISRLPVAGATIHLQPFDVTAVTDEDGLSVVPLSAGAYDVTVKMVGFFDYEVKGVAVETGVTSRRNIVMTRV